MEKQKQKQINVNTFQVNQISKNWTSNKIDLAKLEQFENELSKKDFQLRQLTLNIKDSRLNKEILTKLKNIIQKLEISHTFNFNLACCKIDEFFLLQEILLIPKNIITLNLDLGSINMFDNQIVFICQGMNELINIQRLILSLAGNTIQDLGMDQIMKTISKYSKLEYLNLDVQRNKLKCESGVSFTENLLFCPSLKQLKLNIQENYILNTRLLSNSFSQLYKLENLVEINLVLSNWQSIGILIDQFNQDIFTEFFSNLKNIKSLRILKLFLWSNLFQNIQICSSLNQTIISLHQLKVLELRYFYNSLEFLKQCVYNLQHHQQLTVLDFAFTFSNFLMKKIPTLMKIKRLVQLRD